MAALRRILIVRRHRVLWLIKRFLLGIPEVTEHYLVWNMSGFDAADGGLGLTQAAELEAEAVGDVGCDGQGSGAWSQPPTAAETPEEVEHKSDSTDYKVLQNLGAATMRDLYDDLEKVPFPTEKIKLLLGSGATEVVDKFQGALQLSFECVLLVLVSLASFPLYRTVAMYTPMLGIPPLPWMVHLGRTGEGKSILVWLIKQTVLELQARINRRRKARAKEAKEEAKKGRRSRTAESCSAGSAGDRSADTAMVAARDTVDPEHNEEGGDYEFLETDLDEDDKVTDEGTASLTADTGTVYGWGAKLKSNNGRLMVALHEGKPLMSKVIHDSPGCDPQSLNKLFDRDEFSNTVLTAGSRFQEYYPWVVLWLAMHAEDMKDLFAPGKDPLGIFNRFDWFARAANVPDLKDYNSLEQDDAIYYLADLLDIIEAQFPSLAHDKRKAFSDPDYSMRTNLWRIKQDSRFFQESFTMHSKAQRDAKACGDEKRASFESKVKTKECRYSVPVDALCKAIQQKEVLESYRKHKYEEAVGSGDDKGAWTWQMKDILDVRTALLEDGEKCVELHFHSRWPIAVTDAHAEIGHLITNFLGLSSGLCSSWLQGRALNIVQPTTEPKETAVRIMQGDALETALVDVSVPKVLRNCAVLLGVRYQMFKLSTVRSRLSSNKEISIAVSVLQEAGLMRLLSWKKPGSTGYAAACCAKTPAPTDDSVAMMELRNVLRKIFGVASGDDFLATEIDDAVGTLTDAGISMPVITTQTLGGFSEHWGPRLRPGPSSLVQTALGLAGRARVAITMAMSPSKRSTSAMADLADGEVQGSQEERERPPGKRSRMGEHGDSAKPWVVQKEKVCAIKAHFLWVLTRTDKVEIKKHYVQSKIAGFDKDGDHWEVLKGFLGALGLIREGHRRDSQSFTILKPEKTEDVNHVVEKLGEWLSFEQTARSALQKKLEEKATANSTWEKTTFDYVLASVCSQGSESQPKVKVTQ